MPHTDPVPYVAIACGGTGGHLFPGLAVAEELRRRHCTVTVLISPKEIDQLAVRSLSGIEAVTLPAVAMSRAGLAGFLSGFFKSYRAAAKLFRARRPQAVLAMGGFTCAPPILAGRMAGAKTFLHEANSVPGKANRWLAPLVTDAFVYFPEASGKLRAATVQVAGMPVREQFEEMDAGAARMSLGLNPQPPVLLITGGSQGASGINQLVLESLPILTHLVPDLQFLHLTGSIDFEKVRQAYAGRPAIVRPFLSEMELALSAATVAISRAGASSLAEFAALRTPAILIPYPAAADNHQYHNAKSFVETGAARMLDQASATAEHLAGTIADLVRNSERRTAMQAALLKWHSPGAAGQIAEAILNRIAVAGPASGPVSGRRERIPGAPSQLTNSKLEIPCAH